MLQGPTPILEMVRVPSSATEQPVPDVKSSPFAINADIRQPIQKHYIFDHPLNFQHFHNL